ncbi:MAG: hypothetical protein QOI46_6332, partial [Alphaproteobacteria bacterium]|nr:hypothetical protein [Alphaproteobacteria bacterium]
LSLGVAVESDGEFVRLRRVRMGRDVESGRVEARQVLITGVADGAQDLEVVDSLEEISLAQTVVTDDDGTIRR